jgi:uncharacterized cupin superfamily protein
MTTPVTIRFDPNADLEIWSDFPESEISSGTRASIGHRWLDDTAAGVSAGIWEAEANLGRWMKWPVHEFMIILEGEVVIVEENSETVIGPGESFFFPKGRRCIWNQSGYAKKFMMIFDDTSGAPAVGDTPVIKFDPRVALAPSESLPVAMLRSPVPVQQAHCYFEDATGQFSAGVWETTGYERKLWNSPRHELMHIVEGSVTFGNDKGETQVFGPGDTFLVPLGAATTWKSEGTLRKIYCIFQPKAA